MAPLFLQSKQAQDYTNLFFLVSFCVFFFLFQSFGCRVKSISKKCTAKKIMQGFISCSNGPMALLVFPQQQSEPQVQSLSL